MLLTRQDLLCSISKDLLRRPVAVETGDVYDKYRIVHWLRHHDTNPNTNQILSSTVTVPVPVLARFSRELAAELGEYVPPLNFGVLLDHVRSGDEERAEQAVAALCQDIYTGDAPDDAVQRVRGFLLCASPKIWRWVARALFGSSQVLQLAAELIWPAALQLLSCLASTVPGWSDTLDLDSLTFGTTRVLFLFGALRPNLQPVSGWTLRRSDSTTSRLGIFAGFIELLQMEPTEQTREAVRTAQSVAHSAWYSRYPDLHPRLLEEESTGQQEEAINAVVSLALLQGRHVPRLGPWLWALGESSRLSPVNRTALAHLCASGR